MPGTSAGLTYSDILTVYDLLHGLMLPSGNDAAIALAEWGGKNIRKYCSLAQKFTS
jgi:D-alanyl-D-alanine carboxypeptidase